LLLIAAERGWEVGALALTDTIRFPLTVILTCTGPNDILVDGPVYDLEADAVAVPIRGSAVGAAAKITGTLTAAAVSERRDMGARRDI
jgi:hypothetical protein